MQFKMKDNENIYIDKWLLTKNTIENDWPHTRELGAEKLGAEEPAAQRTSAQTRIV